MTARRLFIISASVLMLASMTVASLAGPPAGKPGNGGARGRMQGIIAGLKLTPGQKVKMQKIEQASQPRLQAIFMNNKLTPDQKRTQAFPIMETERKQFMAILTPAQKAKLMAEMQATPGRKGGPSH